MASNNAAFYPTDPSQSKKELPPYSEQPSYPHQPYPQQAAYAQQVYPQQTNYPQLTTPSMIAVPGGPPLGPLVKIHQPNAPLINMHPELYLDESENDLKGFGFSDKSIRRGFIRKVYSILMVQLAITGSMIAWFVYHNTTKRFVQTHPELMIVALVLALILTIMLVCCDSLRRKSPANIILLILFTVVEGFMLGVMSSFYRSEEILLAAGITAVVCLGLTLFAFQTKWDFTILGGGLFVFFIIIFTVGMAGMFYQSKLFTMIYAGIGALLFSLYLIYDTQLLIGGQHKYTISPEEYVFAALTLYLDVIRIFIYVLRIIGLARS